MDKINIVLSHGFKVKLLAQNRLAYKKDMADFFTPKTVKYIVFTPKKQVTLQFTLTPIDENLFTSNTLESLDSRFGPYKQAARAYPSKLLHMRNMFPLVNYFLKVLNGNN